MNWIFLKKYKKSGPKYKERLPYINFRRSSYCNQTLAAPNTNSISAYFWSVCWEKTLGPNPRVIISWLWGQYFHQTSPFLNWLKLGICVRKIHEISGNQIFVCFDFGCQVIFYQTFSSFYFLGTFLEKLSLWLKSKNINSVLLIPNLDQ